jgi:hypothetical protein
MKEKQTPIAQHECVTMIRSAATGRQQATSHKETRDTQDEAVHDQAENHEPMLIFLPTWALVASKGFNWLLTNDACRGICIYPRGDVYVGICP